MTGITIRFWQDKPQTQSEHSNPLEVSDPVKAPKKNFFSGTTATRESFFNLEANREPMTALSRVIANVKEPLRELSILLTQLKELTNNNNTQEKIYSGSKFSNQYQK